MITLYEEAPELLHPLTRLRPVWNLRVGAQTLWERVSRAFPDKQIGAVGRPEVAGAWASRNERELSVGGSGGHYLNAGLALTPALATTISALTEPTRLLDGAEEFVGVWNAPEPAAVTSRGLLDADDLNARSRTWTTLILPDAACLRQPHDFIRHLDCLLIGDSDWYPRDSSVSFDGVRVLGNGGVFVHPSASVDPGTTLDTREGPIVIEAGAVVSFGTWLLGPALIGRDTRLLGGTIGPLVGIGPTCRIRGEVAESFVHGFSNKAHDGFIGHSVLGEWVNLGAMTSCSDLKNNYGTIRLRFPSGEVDTGLHKFGILAGDHVKAAIGTLFNTGTVIDVGANVFGGGGLSPKSISAFAWGDKGAPGSYEIEPFLVTAKRVFERRAIAWDPATEDLLRDVHRAAASGRIASGT